MEKKRYGQKENCKSSLKYLTHKIEVVLISVNRIPPVWER